MRSNAVPYRCLWDEDASFAAPQTNSPEAGYDVVIVGGGLTGLWSALYLAEADSRLSIAVIDKEHVGFGASGRNGGWCSAILPMSLESIERDHGFQQAVRMQEAMNETVALVGSETRRLGIDCDFEQGGTVTLARSGPQVDRARQRVASARRFGFGSESVRLLDTDETSALTRARGVRGGVFESHCAAVHPGRLVRGLRHAVERAGVSVIERTEVVAIEPHRVHLREASIEARWIIRATEGFTSTIRGLRREVLPIHSLMIATEPLGETELAEVGFDSRATFTDGRNMIIYGQRTADSRIAFGGRGAPYHFASSVSQNHSTSSSVAEMLRSSLVDLFPALAGTRVTHHWGGPLGARRNWTSGVSADPTTGLAIAGGYVGDGVATTNLAGRTLAALITGADDPVTTLPWVGSQSRRWEPEPIRWLSVNALTGLARLADRHEARTDRDARLINAIIARVSGG